MFPEQIREGLRPWQPLKLYMGGVRENEDWTLGIDTGALQPVARRLVRNFARIGLSFQRSQNGGRVAARRDRRSRTTSGSPQSSAQPRPAKETSFFDGIDTSLPGLFRALREPHRPAPPRLLAAIDAAGAARRSRRSRCRSVGVGAGARARPGGDAHGDRKAGAEPDAVFCCGSRNSSSGRDQHGARHRLRRRLRTCRTGDRRRSARQRRRRSDDPRRRRRSRDPQVSLDRAREHGTRNVGWQSTCSGADAERASVRHRCRVIVPRDAAADAAVLRRQSIRHRATRSRDAAQCRPRWPRRRSAPSRIRGRRRAV